mgnify:CR=1 FL=1|tara:strand:+ start:4008 stop:5471 length:1464 start_codon:yes stop_codon:yes gene_type:complete
MADVKNPNVLEKPGDYNLKEIVIVNSRGERADIKASVLELNLFESIHQGSMLGTLIVTDSLNLVNLVPITGKERLYFKLTTAGATGPKDAINANPEDGYPFHIYKLANRKEIEHNVSQYILYFGTREFVRNLRTKVSQAYSGDISASALKILKDEQVLDSKKPVFFEPTRNAQKFVIPNMRPLKAIGMLADKALSKNGKGAGYYFYETTKGFYFRSWENMCSIESLHKREPKMIFRYDAKKIPNVPERIFMNERAIDAYEFKQHFDSASQTAQGVYSQNVIFYNFFNKEIQRTNWKFHHHWEDLKHTDEKNLPQLNDPVDVDPKDDGIGDKGVGDYISSKTTLVPTTRFAHNDNTGAYGDDPGSEGLTEAIKNYQYASIKNNILVITIKGHANLQSGDMIQVDIPPIDKDKTKRKDTGQQYDDHHSGNYIITAIHHKVIDQQYLQICECVKDSVREAYRPARVEYSGKKEKEGQIISQYDIDRLDNA